MLIFDEESHTYCWNGTIVPSVTQVLDRVGVKKQHNDGNWYWNSIAGDFMKDENAALFGTAFHAVAEFFEKGETCTYDDRMKPWIKQYHRFRSDYPQGEVVMIEKPLYHTMLRYAGTPDCVEYRDGVLHLWDWKTSNAVSKTWTIQLEAYIQLVLRELGLPYHTKYKLNAVQFLKDDYKIIGCRNKNSFNKFRSYLNVLRDAA